MNIKVYLLYFCLKINCQMQLSIIFTTYNSPKWLSNVLTGFSYQSYRDFEIIIADDGSSEDTKKIIDSFRQKISSPIIHVWHEDKGFRKCEILNKAVLASTSDYLVFTDGDCIPHYQFMQTHFEKKEKGYFLSGGYFKLPMNISESITHQDILSGRCFDIKWLKSLGLESSFKNTKLIFNKNFSMIMNKITPTNASWNGHNSSCWKKDILAINGFDENMHYGSEDREFGERLINFGIKSRQIRYSAICIHLDHSRGYVNKEDLNNNASIRKETNVNKKVWTNFGIIKNA